MHVNYRTGRAIVSVFEQDARSTCLCGLLRCSDPASFGGIFKLRSCQEYRVDIGYKHKLKQLQARFVKSPTWRWHPFGSRRSVERSHQYHETRDSGAFEAVLYKYLEASGVHCCRCRCSTSLSASYVAFSTFCFPWKSQLLR